MQHQETEVNELKHDSESIMSHLTDNLQCPCCIYCHSSFSIYWSCTVV